MACHRRMDAHIKDLKSKKDHNWKRKLVESFETTLSDPKVSSNVEKYVVPDSDPVEALRGQLGLKTVMACDIFVIGVFRSRMMLELPTYLEQERWALLPPSALLPPCDHPPLLISAPCYPPPALPPLPCYPPPLSHPPPSSPPHTHCWFL